MNSGLTIQQQAIISIAAFAASGDTEQLKPPLENGLSAGLSVNEIKEVLIQLHAYAGFPRSLSALNVFLGVLDARKAAGITDKAGPVTHELPEGTDRRAAGTKIQTDLVGRPVTGRIYEFAPVMDTFLKEHLFCDIFSRGALLAGPGTGGHFRIGKFHAGILQNSSEVCGENRKIHPPSI